MATDRQRALELLPWYVNGTLEEAERAEVEAALAEDPSLRETLAQTAATGALFASAPSTEVLVAYAAGELEEEEAGREVADWLRSRENESELVGLAELGLESAADGDARSGSKASRDVVSADPESADPERAPSSDAWHSGWRGWPVAAAAALVVAAISSVGWWQARMDLRSEPSSAAISPISVLELAPLEARRSADAAAPDLGEDPVTLLLVVTARESWDRVFVELRTGDGEAIERRNVEPSPDGFVSLLFDPGRLPDARRLALLGERGGEVETIHEYLLGE